MRFVAYKIDGTAKRVQNTAIDPLPPQLAKILEHPFRILVAQFRRVAKTQIPEIAGKTRPDTGYGLERLQSFARDVAHRAHQSPYFSRMAALNSSVLPGGTLRDCQASPAKC